MEEKNMKVKGLKEVGLFALGTLFGLEGIKLLSSKDAKKVYSKCTAGVLRAKDCVMDQVTTLQENCTDIYEEAKAINAERAKKEEEAEVKVEDEA
ncbi:MAG: hypothetical protein IJM91_01150 [Lachnospiraceae bacterium]|nr:hypothetical protein [Lachnospiraceae bacterium]